MSDLQPVYVIKENLRIGAGKENIIYSREGPGELYAVVICANQPDYEIYIAVDNEELRFKPSNVYDRQSDMYDGLKQVLVYDTVNNIYTLAFRPAKQLVFNQRLYVVLRAPQSQLLAYSIELYAGVKE